MTFHPPSRVVVQRVHLCVGSESVLAGRVEEITLKYTCLPYCEQTDIEYPDKKVLLALIRNEMNRS